MNRDTHNLVTKNDYGNFEMKSFAYTVELFKQQKAKGEDTHETELTIELALENMRIGKGQYKNHPILPHPELNRAKTRILDKEVFAAILEYYDLTKQYKKIHDIRRAARFFYSPDKTKQIGFINILKLILLFIKNLFK